MKNLLWLDNIDKSDSEKLGEKTGNLGELKNKTGIPVPKGFVATPQAYNNFLQENNLKEKIRRILDGIDTEDVSDLHNKSEQIRSHIKEADISKAVRKEIEESYKKLGKETGGEKPLVAIRTSITKNDKQNKFQNNGKDTYLNISGEKQILEKIKECYASLFTNKLISQRENGNEDHFKNKPSIIIQQMVNKGEGVSGAAFTLDPETGLENIISINGSYGLGKHIIEGKVNPDEFILFKNNLGIIKKVKGQKDTKLTGKTGKNKIVNVPKREREKTCLTNNQIKELAKYSVKIEEHYNNPVRIEWALNRRDKKLYILQAKEEKPKKEKDTIKEHRIETKNKKIIEGEAISNKITSGNIRLLNSAKQIDELKEGEILVTDSTDPEWDPILEKADAIITNKKGRTNHTTIFSRENNTPAVTGTENATSKLSNGETVTVDCSSPTGKIWRGEPKYETTTHQIDEIPETETDVNIEINKPEEALHSAKIPAEKCLAETKDMLSNTVNLSEKIEENEDKYLEILRSGIGEIAAAFHPKDVIMHLNGQEYFENKQESPKNNRVKKIQEMEIKAVKECLKELKLDNLKITVTSCNTIKEAKKKKAEIKKHGLEQYNIDIYLSVESPSNIICANEFSKLFNGFSVNLSKLEKSTLGKTNSDKIKSDPAVKKLVNRLCQVANKEDLYTCIKTGEESKYNNYSCCIAESCLDGFSVQPNSTIEARINIAEAENKDKRDVYEFNTDSMIGKAAEEVYEILEEHGGLNVDEISHYTSKKVDDQSLNQALGWLANEGKIRLESKNSKVIYYPEYLNRK